MSNMKTVYTTGEAARICKVSQQTIIRCFDSGQSFNCCLTNKGKTST